MHLKEKCSFLNIGIALLRKLRCSITRKPIFNCWAFSRPHVDYCDAIYNKPPNEKFIDTLEFIQYNATRTRTGDI